MKYLSSIKMFHVKHYLLLIVLSGCSNVHDQDIIIEKQAYMMSRQEVITAIEDCKTSNLRPMLFYGSPIVTGKQPDKTISKR